MTLIQMVHLILYVSLAPIQQQKERPKKLLEANYYSIRGNNWNSMKPNISAYKVMLYM